MFRRRWRPGQKRRTCREFRRYLARKETLWNTLQLANSVFTCFHVSIDVCPQVRLRCKIKHIAKENLLLLIVPDSACMAMYHKFPKWDSERASDQVTGRRSKDLEQKFDGLKRRLRIGASRQRKV